MLANATGRLQAAKEIRDKQQEQRGKHEGPTNASTSIDNPGISGGSGVDGSEGGLSGRDTPESEPAAFYGLREKLSTIGTPSNKGKLHER